MHLQSRTGRAVQPRLGDRFAAGAARAVLVAAVFAGALASPARAQEADAPSPLSKSQLVRLVMSSTYTQAEIVEIVAATCLSFQPTDRDLSDLSSLGASTPVLDTIRNCGSADSAAAGQQADAQPAAGQPAAGQPGAQPGGAAPAAGAVGAVAIGALGLAARDVSGEVGTTVSIVGSLRRDGEPVAGQRLVLRGSGSVVGGAGADLTALTDVTGGVAFSVPTGTAARVYPLTIEAENGALETNRNVELTVRPGPPTRADLSPAELALRPDGEPSPIEVTIRDQHGNAIPGTVVGLVLPAAAGGSTLPGTTDSRGVAFFSVVTTGLSEGDRLDLLSGGSTIEEIIVGAPATPLVAEKQDDPDAAGAVVAAGAGAGAAGAGVSAGAQGAGGAPGADAASADSLLAEGRRAEDARDYARADIFYREAFDADPGSVEAQKALGGLSMARGQPENAMLWYQAAVGAEPDDAALWLGLGYARAEAGYADEANAAFRRVLELDPGNAEAQQMLEGYGPRQPLLNASIWGGNTFDNERSAGLRAAELTVWPVPTLSIWGRYDNSLALYQWALVRGQDDVEGLYGGAGLDWGSGRSLSTRFEIGRREPPGSSGVHQNFYHLEQGLRVTSGVNAVRVAAGGYVGRWFDRDDWQVYTKAEIPAGAELTFLPAIYVGETVGSAFAEVGRVAANEIRGYLTVDFRPVRAVRLQPSFGFGSVSSDDARLDGTLVDALFQLSVGSGIARGEMFLRYQDAPGVESFAVLAIGLTVGVPRGGF